MTPEEQAESRKPLTNSFTIVSSDAEFQQALIRFLGSYKTVEAESTRVRVSDSDAIEALSAAERELDEIKRETVEYVHDGTAFNWTEAIIAIRQWREDLAAAEKRVEAMEKWNTTVFDELSRWQESVTGSKPSGGHSLDRITVIAARVRRDCDQLRSKVSALHDQLDAAGVTQPDGIHGQLEDRVRELVADRDRLAAEVRVLRLKARVVDRLPFCPDHRDKVAGKPCRECEIERLAGEVDSLKTQLDGANCRLVGMRDAGLLLLRVSLPPNDCSGNAMWEAAARFIRFPAESAQPSEEEQ